MQARIITLFVVLLLLAACSGQHQKVTDLPATQDPSAAADLQSALPALPPAHATLGLKEHLINGNETYEQSAGAVVDGTTLVLGGAVGELNWALYAFDAAGNPVDSLHVLFDTAGGHMVWTAVADYSSGRWEYFDPSDQGATVLLDNARHVSAGGVIYIAVLAEGGADTTLNALSVRTVNPSNQPPSAMLSATAIGTQPPCDVQFSTAGSTDSDGSISHYLWDFDSDGLSDAISYQGDISYFYETSGDFTPAVIVVDNEGAFGGATTEVYVNYPPVVNFVFNPAEGNPGEPLLADASASYDPDGTIVSYQWDYDNDGFAEFGGPEPSLNGSFPDLPSALKMTVTVVDNIGATATATAEGICHGWTPGQTFIGGSGGVHAKMIILPDGMPAIAYAQEQTQFPDLFHVYFRRASDAEGMVAWGNEILVDSVPGEVNYLSPAVVNGYPAILYIRDDNPNSTINDNTLVYTSAFDKEGSVWGPLNNVADLSSDANSVSLTTLQGVPAAAFIDFDLHFCTALDSVGNVWGPVELVDSNSWDADLKIVQGRPALAYSTIDDGGLMVRYKRASDPLGLTWPMDGEDVVANDNPTNTQLEMIHSRPVVAFTFDNIDDNIYISHSTTTYGSQWTAPVLVNVPSNGESFDLYVAGGQPVLGFVDAEGFSRFSRALDSEGLDWDSGVILRDEENTSIIKLLTLSTGRLAFTHANTSSVGRYIHVLY